MGLSPAEMHKRILENLEEKTGHDFAYWRGIVEQILAAENSSAQVAELKSQHGLGHYTAVTIVKQVQLDKDSAE